MPARLAAAIDDRTRPRRAGRTVHGHPTLHRLPAGLLASPCSAARRRRGLSLQGRRHDGVLGRAVRGRRAGPSQQPSHQHRRGTDRAGRDCRAESGLRRRPPGRPRRQAPSSSRKPSQHRNESKCRYGTGPAAPDADLAVHGTGNGNAISPRCGSALPAAARSIRRFCVGTGRPGRTQEPSAIALGRHGPDRSGGRIARVYQ